MIIIIPIEKVDGEVLDYLRYKLDDVFNVRFKIAESIKVDNAYDTARNQYKADVILNALNRFQYKVLGVTEWDIYVGGMNFIFGLADLGGNALISTARLNPEFWCERSDKELLKKRALKESVHELGHSFGLSHCRNYCLMQFSNSLYEADLKPMEFCADCMKKLKI